MQIVDEYCARRGSTSGCVFMRFYTPHTIPTTSSPLPSVVVNVPAVPNNTGPKRIDPASSTRMGSITYDQDNGYNLEWESISEFNIWLSYEQVAHGIEIWRQKIERSKVSLLYLTCETYRCARNGIGRKSHYMKKTAHERKINTKRIDGSCPCIIRIKTYPYTSTVLGKYNHDHSHPTGKDNLKYNWIWVPI